MEIGQEKLWKLVERLLAGEVVLPDIQRDFVWAGAKIPRLLDSIYREWPIGSVLLWHTNLDIPIKHAAVVQKKPVGVKPAILLDGQQRITTLARVMAPESVPDGQKPPDIRYHPGKDEFQTSNAVSGKDPAWLKVSEILRDGAQFFELLEPVGLPDSDKTAWYERLSLVARRIRNYPVPLQVVTADDYETVAEIFNRVNTGGRPLSKGDLIMGVLAARWPGKASTDGPSPVEGGRQRIEAFEESVAAKGWPLNREVLLRTMSVLTKESPNHTRLLELREEEAWRAGWGKTENAVNHALGFLQDDAGIPTKALLPTEYVLVVPATLLSETHGAFDSPADRDRLRRWVFLASAFGHYSGSLETRLAADVNVLRTEEPAARLSTLIRLAQEPRTPGAQVTADDLRGKTRRSPFLKLLQIAAVQRDAKTWWSHRSITYDPHSQGMAVQIHHVFPKNWLKKNGLPDHLDTDTLANFAFLSQHDNVKISDGDPAEYLSEADEEELAGQWIPTDPDLWRADRFGDFCEKRCELLAAALDELLGLTEISEEVQPLDADESPEPDVGAWAEDLDDALRPTT